jgi:hypothetical protein
MTMIFSVLPRSGAPVVAADMMRTVLPDPADRSRVDYRDGDTKLFRIQNAWVSTAGMGEFCVNVPQTLRNFDPANMRTTAQKVYWLANLMAKAHRYPGAANDIARSSVHVATEDSLTVYTPGSLPHRVPRSSFAVGYPHGVDAAKYTLRRLPIQRDLSAARSPGAVIRRIAAEFAEVASEVASISRVLQVGTGSTFLQADAGALAEASDDEIAAMSSPAA